MTADLLPLRLTMLLRGLKDVQHVLEAGEDISKALRNARNSAEDAIWFIEDVGKLAGDAYVAEALGELSGFLAVLDKDPAFADIVRRHRWRVSGVRWRNALSTVVTELREYQSSIDSMTASLKAVQGELSQIEDRVVPFEEGFDRTIGDEILALTTAIDTLSKSLDGGDPPEELWSTYFEHIQPRVRRLFSDYLDLLGGVTIRERGLAISALRDVCHLDDICALADSHLAEELTLCLDSDRATYVTLPGPDAVGEVPPWPIFRLGFASWSIWGLPLAGLEFGKLVADAHLERRSADETWERELAELGIPGLRVLIADTLATWAEGPAYACALLFLVLDPTAPPVGSSQEGVSDAERADLVLAILAGGPPGESGSRAAGGYDYEPFVQALDARWRGERPRVDPSLSPRARLLERLPGRVVQVLGLKKPFKLEDWRLSKRVLDHLVRDEPLPDDPVPGVRHLTNAAWRGRLAPDRGPRDDADVAEDPSYRLELDVLRVGMGLFQRRTQTGVDKTEAHVNTLKGSSAAS